MVIKDKWLPVSEVARRLNMTPAAIRYNITNTGLLTGRKVGSRWYIDPDTLSNIEARLAGASPGKPTNVARGLPEPNRGKASVYLGLFVSDEDLRLIRAKVPVTIRAKVLLALAKMDKETLQRALQSLGVNDNETTG